MLNMKSANKHNHIFGPYQSLVFISLLLISSHISPISATISWSASQLVYSTEEPAPEQSLEHTCLSSSDCYNDRIEDCERCYSSSDQNLERCTTYSRITYTVLRTISSIFQRRTLDRISNILLDATVDVQSPYCVGFSYLMFSNEAETGILSLTEPHLNIGSYAFINSRGAERLLEGELSNVSHIVQSQIKDIVFNISSEMLYNTTTKEIRKQEYSAIATYRKLATGNRLPTHLKLLITSTKYIRRQIVSLAIRKLTLKPEWSDVYVGDTRKFTIRRKSNRVFVVFIPYHTRFSNEFRRWCILGSFLNYSD